MPVWFRGRGGGWCQTGCLPPLRSTNTVLPGCHEAASKEITKEGNEQKSGKEQKGTKKKKKGRPWHVGPLDSSLLLVRNFRSFLLLRNFRYYVLVIRCSFATFVISLWLLHGNHHSALCLCMPSGSLFTAFLVSRVGLGRGSVTNGLVLALWDR